MKQQEFRALSKAVAPEIPGSLKMDAKEIGVHDGFDVGVSRGIQSRRDCVMLHKLSARNHGPFRFVADRFRKQRRQGLTGRNSEGDRSSIRMFLVSRRDRLIEVSTVR